ncbi:MAG: nucleotidyltransferase domain-containing protein [Wenzhouxiangella sp.]|nr:MAG: nucleotidyltransferase domain-containing protein [Wenzhouxiangella sp.]
MSNQAWGLRAEEVNGIRRVLAAHPAVEKAIVYGSRALGTQKPGSDIDITLIGQMAWSELHQIETDLDNLDLPYTIDLSLASQIENQALSQHIQKHGQQLYPATPNE